MRKKSDSNGADGAIFRIGSPYVCVSSCSIDPKMAACARAHAIANVCAVHVGHVSVQCTRAQLLGGGCIFVKRSHPFYALTVVRFVSFGVHEARIQLRPSTTSVFICVHADMCV